jgi:chemotaxis family two-component system sensor kinase Cph1
VDQSAVIYSDESLLNAPVTLTNCDREPIHIPGSVQPYGFLLCLDEETKRVVHASENTQALLGIAAENLIGTGLEQLLSPATVAYAHRNHQAAGRPPGAGAGPAVLQNHSAPLR